MWPKIRRSISTIALAFFFSRRIFNDDSELIFGPTSNMNLKIHIHREQETKKKKTKKSWSKWQRYVDL